MIEIVIDIPEASSFVDDVWASSATVEDNLATLRALFSKMDKREMYLNLSKCEFFKSEVNFLGYRVSVRGVESTTDRISALTSFKNPQTLKHYANFSGWLHLTKNHPEPS